MINIVINGQYRNFEDPPIIRNGRTLLPLRHILVALGVTDDSQHILWNDSNKSISVKYKDIDIFLKINDSSAKVNNKIMKLDQSPIINNGRTYLPTRFISEALNKKVIWDDDYRCVYINDNDSNENIKNIWQKVKNEYKNIKDYSYKFTYSNSNSLQGTTFYKKEIEEFKKAYPNFMSIEDVTGDLISDISYSKKEDLSDSSYNTETYSTYDFLYNKISKNKWFKFFYIDSEEMSLSEDSKSEIPRSTREIFKNFTDLLDESNFAGYVFNEKLSNNNSILIEGGAFPKSLKPIVGKVLNQSSPSLRWFYKINTKNSDMKLYSYKTKISINKTTYRINNIEIQLQLKVESEKEGKPISMIVDKKLVFDFHSYNTGKKITLPKEVLDAITVMPKTEGTETPNLTPRKNEITNRNLDEDYKLVKGFKTLDQYVKLLGDWGNTYKTNIKKGELTTYEWFYLKQGSLELKILNNKIYSYGTNRLNK